MRLLSAAASPKETSSSQLEYRNCYRVRESPLWRRAPRNEGVQSLRMGDRSSLLCVVPDDAVCCGGRPLLQAAGARGRPVFLDQDNDRADLLAGGNDRRHDVAGHRPDREETAGNALAVLPEERNQTRYFHDLCQRPRQYAEGGDPRHLVSGSQEGRRHKINIAARHSRTEL